MTSAPEECTDEEWLRAIESGGVEEVRRLAERCAGRALPDGEYAIHKAARADNDEVVGLLIQYELGVRQAQDHTALMIAAQLGNLRCVRALLPHEAWAFTQTDVDALMLAASCGQFDACGLLYQAIGPREDRMGFTALHYAAASGYLSICKYLIGIKDSYTPAQIRSAAELAECNGRQEVLTYLNTLLPDPVVSPSPFLPMEMPSSASSSTVSKPPLRPSTPLATATPLAALAAVTGKEVIQTGVPTRVRRPPKFSLSIMIPMSPRTEGSRLQHIGPGAIKTPSGEEAPILGDSSGIGIGQEPELRRGSSTRSAILRIPTESSTNDASVNTEYTRLLEYENTRLRAELGISLAGAQSMMGKGQGSSSEATALAVETMTTAMLHRDILRLYHEVAELYVRLRQYEPGTTL
ncbi:Ankyrin repeat protein 1 [Giardia muris]|uniref:Ankyrin repeat protein 1 n=1 Tax=Giardia muris TaxID=5742 RepID=A0A4Z1SQ46_GIAMU|nr:Ankyrin repeat protein 1 [Giardia muris]|eukprot:TNJ27005.1 Ankyrin repeat protein 1 [Giardia muris]